MTDFRELLRRALRKIDELEARLQTASGLPPEPIAIVGLSCRFPGGATPAAFYASLLAGQDRVVAVPAERLGGSTTGRAPRWAGLLDTVDDFDAPFFGISPRESARIDPQQRLLLEVCYEALEDAGAVPERLVGSATGVFVGLSFHDHKERVDALPESSLDHAAVLGSLGSVAAGRVAYTLGLRGPALTVDTACSSSLVAVHLAALSLSSRETDLALAGGVNVILSPRMFSAAHAMQALSPDGRCKTFDARANGFVRGEGCGVLALKRLSDARRDRDRVLAVLRATTVNQDGRSTGLSAPSGPAQEALLRTALERAGIRAEEVSFLEAHGTGTALGDPIEVDAIRAVYGAPRPSGLPLYLGAVKTHIGHLESAAGVAGLIKTVLALRGGVIPGNLHLRTLSPHIRLTDPPGSPLRLPDGPTPWPETARRIAAVSSFGISGTNAHALVELEADEPVPPPPLSPPRGEEPPTELLLLSAAGPTALAEAAERLGAHLLAHDELALADVANTLRCRRAQLPDRLAALCQTRDEAVARLVAARAGQAQPGLWTGQVEAVRPLALLLSGQGAQEPRMGSGLYAGFPVFREALDRCAGLAAHELPQPLLEVMFAPPGTASAERLAQTEFTQIALFSLEYALFALLSSWGLAPAVLLGHSVGELAAACVAGAFSLEDGVRLVCARGRLMQSLPPGAMCSVEASAEAVQELLRARPTELSLAAHNAPQQIVLSGSEPAVEEATRVLRARGHRVQRLRVTRAFHSPLVTPALAELRRVAASVRFRRPRLPLVSNVSGRLAGDEILQPDYWVEQARATVRFADGVQAAVAAGAGGFVELGPRASLLALAARCLPATPARPLLPTLQPGQPETASLLATLGRLFVAGAEIALHRVEPERGRMASLPTYPFQRQPYPWPGAQAATPAAPRTDSAAHPLLGPPLALPGTPATFVWQRSLGGARLAWLQEHRLRGEALLPAAAIIEAALAAAHALLTPGALTLTGLRLQQPLRLDAGEQRSQPPSIQVVLTEEAAGSCRFQLASSSSAPPGGPPPRVHAVGRIGRLAAAAGATESLDEVRRRCTRPVDPAVLYARLRASGIDHGPSFQGLVACLAGPGEALGLVRAPDEALAHAAYLLHPAALDACLHPLAAALGEGDDDLVVPVALRELRWHRAAAGRLWSHARWSSATEAQLRIFSEAGELVAELDGLEVRRRSRARTEDAETARDQTCWQLHFRPAPITAPHGTAQPGSWLLLCDGQGLAQRLAAGLRQAGQQVHLHRAADGLDAPSLARLVAESGPLRGIVSLAALDDRPVEQLSPSELGSLGERGWAQALAVVQALALQPPAQLPALYLFTERAHPAGAIAALRPEQGVVLGLGAAIRHERPELRCRRIDLGDATSAEEAEAAVRVLLSGDEAEPVAVRGAVPWVAELVPLPPAGAPQSRFEPAEGRPYRLVLPEARGASGALAVLQPLARREPAADEVELQVEAAGLNFRDVLRALGVLPAELGGLKLLLGGECAGRVLRCGPARDAAADPEALRPGDAVLAWGSDLFRSHVTLPVANVLRIPANVSIEQAAGLVVAHVTAYHALHEVAQLRRGERLLVHSASGGVGLAAIQWARHVGAEVMATAGSEPKRQALRALGLQHISDSRSDAFVRDVLAWTDGQGADVVLNTLSGPLLHAGFAALGRFGRFIDLTKRDHAEGLLAMQPFLRCLSYSLVDLGALAELRPRRFRELVRTVLGQVERGVLTPLPTRVLPLAQFEEGARRMRQEDHVGKLVFSLPSTAPIEIPAPPPALARADGSYLITGGLSGLGLLAAEVLARAGAGHLILLGRSGIPAESRERLAQLRTKVTVAVQDVADAAALSALLAALPADQPLRGVVHAAGVLDDALLPQQSSARLRPVLAAKAAGAVNLDRLTAHQPLDFFVLYSSIAPIVGAAAQANYAAASAVLDVLAHGRRARGLPATVVNWGPVADTKMTRSPQVQARIARLGGALSQAHSAQILERILREQPPQVVVLSGSLETLAHAFPHLRGGPLLRASSPLPPQLPLRQVLRQASPSERRKLLETELQAHVAAVLQLPPSQPLPRTRPLISLGLDSLLALELQHRLEAALGVPLSVAMLLGGEPLAHVIDRIAERLDEQPAAPLYDEGEV
ncbi:MAG: SDR family NAD(P)-dependent oxidoreductase [Polyangia bacterium]